MLPVVDHVITSDLMFNVSIDEGTVNECATLSPSFLVIEFQANVAARVACTGCEVLLRHVSIDSLLVFLSVLKVVKKPFLSAVGQFGSLGPIVFEFVAVDLIENLLVLYNNCDRCVSPIGGECSGKTGGVNGHGGTFIDGVPSVLEAIKICNRPTRSSHCSFMALRLCNNFASASVLCLL